MSFVEFLLATVRKEEERGPDGKWIAGGGEEDEIDWNQHDLDRLKPAERQKLLDARTSAEIAKQGIADVHAKMQAHMRVLAELNELMKAHAKNHAAAAKAADRIESRNHFTEGTDDMYLLHAHVEDLSNHIDDLSDVNSDFAQHAFETGE